MLEAVEGEDEDIQEFLREIQEEERLRREAEDEDSGKKKKKKKNKDKDKKKGKGKKKSDVNDELWDKSGTTSAVV